MGSVSPIQRVLTIKARFWGGTFSKLHNLNLTCNKPLISTESHSMDGGIHFSAVGFAPHIFHTNPSFS